MHYMCYIRPDPKAILPEQSQDASDIKYTETTTRGHTNEGPLVILGGYSYGSLILRHLPPVPSILQTFVTPIVGSASDEILLRARKLADQSNTAWKELARTQERESRSRRRGHDTKPPVTMGGEETTPEKRRSSREVRRSTDRGLSIDIGNRLRSLSHSHRRHKDDSPPLPLETAANVPITMPDIRYLLISPLTLPISAIVAPTLGHRFWHRSRGGYDDAISKHAALAVYGDQDIFTSAKRIRDWSEQMKATQASQFSSVEVAEAGHFWVEAGMEGKLRSVLKDWEAAVR
jgi:hypothetical protein